MIFSNKLNERKQSERQKYAIRKRDGRGSYNQNLYVWGDGGGEGEGKRILRIIHKTLDTVKGLDFGVTDHILESSWPK